MEAAAIGHLENVEEEPVESNGVNEKLQKEDESEQEEEEYKCAHCEYSTLCWESMKSHSNSLHRKPPSAPSEVNKIKVESEANSKDILAAPGRSEDSEDEPVEFTRDNKKRLKTWNVRNVVFHCSDCDYFTVAWANMKRHRIGHEREEKFQCDRCTFSSRTKSKLSFHYSHYHCKPPSASLEFKEVKKEPKFKEDPAIDEQ